MWQGSAAVAGLYTVAVLEATVPEPVLSVVRTITWPGAVVLVAYSPVGRAVATYLQRPTETAPAPESEPDPDLHQLSDGLQHMAQAVQQIATSQQQISATQERLADAQQRISDTLTHVQTSLAVLLDRGAIKRRSGA